jgi:membrane protein
MLFYIMRKVWEVMKGIWTVTRRTATAWMKADPFRQSAVIAYYAIFSMPALLVIVIACAGLAFGQDAVQGEISEQVSAVLGQETAQQVEEIIARASERKSSIWATIISIVTLLIGCTGVFQQLQVSLNQIWEVKVVAKKKILKTIKDRIFSFGLVLSIAFLLLISLVLTTFVAAISEWAKLYVPGFILVIFEFANFVVSFGVIAVLFALMFKILPDVRIQWKNVWIGAIVTGLFFVIGKFALGFYFGKVQPGSAYGAAGSIVLIMLWVSYSCMIVFFGAEFTKQFTMFFGGEIKPKRDAELILPEEDKQLVKEKQDAVAKIQNNDLF